MFIKRLCVEGCNEPILLQPSSLPVLGGNYVFTGKKEKHDPAPAVLGVAGAGGKGLALAQGRSGLLDLSSICGWQGDGGGWTQLAPNCERQKSHQL